MKVLEVGVVPNRKTLDDGSTGYAAITLQEIRIPSANGVTGVDCGVFFIQGSEALPIMAQDFTSGSLDVNPF